MTDIDISHAKLISAMDGGADANWDVVFALRTALTASLAREAAAFEAAAKLCEDNEVGTSPRIGYVVAPFYQDENSGKHPGMAYGPHIRALTHSDAQAALDRMIADAIRPYQDALIWCSASPDFNEDGVARKGWVELCAPLIAKIGGAL